MISSLELVPQVTGLLFPVTCCLSAVGLNIPTVCHVLHPLEQWSPTFLAPATGFVGDNFSMDWDGGLFGDDSSTLQLVCAIFLPLLHCEVIIQLTIMKNLWEP